MPLRTVFACLACATALPLRGRAQQPLTLQEAVALAQERGLDAQAARAARDAGRYRYQAFRARLLPQLSLGGLGLPSYTYNRSVVPVVQPDGSTLFRYQDQTNAGMSLTLSQKLPVTGGDLFVSSSLARVTVTGSPGIQTWSSTPVVVGLQQDLLRPNVAGWDRREQAVRTELNERTYREGMEAVALGTTERFFDMYAARVALDNAVKNAAVNDTLYRLNTGRFDVGKIGENDLLQSELALLRARSALDAARLEYERSTAALRPPTCRPRKPTATGWPASRARASPRRRTTRITRRCSCCGPRAPWPSSRRPIRWPRNGSRWHTTGT